MWGYRTYLFSYVFGFATRWFSPQERCCSELARRKFKPGCFQRVYPHKAGHLSVLLHCPLGPWPRQTTCIPPWITKPRQYATHPPRLSALDSFPRAHDPGSCFCRNPVVWHIFARSSCLGTRFSRTQLLSCKQTGHKHLDCAWFFSTCMQVCILHNDVDK